jgi:hypothetical protein
MFGLFRKQNKSFEPLNYETRKYFENNIIWLTQEFPEPPIEERKIFTPTLADFPIEWDNSEESAKQALTIIAEHMQLDSQAIELYFFDNPAKEINMGMSSLFLENDPETKEAAGMYHHKNENGKYEISLDRANLSKPDALVATIAHELAHVKLLGEKGLEDNDEILTDLTTVFFGFGVFNANTAFQFSQENDRWGYSKMGYLKQEEWAYCLALVAFMRYEEKPEWSNYLNATIKKDFEKSLKYMLDNEQSIFQFDDEKK